MNGSMTFRPLPAIRRAACALALAIAAWPAGAAGPVPRLWEAVKPDDPGVRVYILAAGADPADGYFDRIVMPAFAGADVLHQEAAAGQAGPVVLCHDSERAGSEASGGDASGCVAADRAALLRAANPAGPATTRTDGCVRADAWLDEIGRMSDGLTHFVIADIGARGRACKGLLHRLADAGYVLWPVAEFRTGQAGN